MIQMNKVRKTFGSIVAVDDLTLHIQRGEVFGLLGPNGAGKTTTLHISIGLIKPDSGTVNIENLGTPEKSEVRTKIGLAPQSLALYDELTAEENLLFFGKLHKLSGSHLKTRVDESLEFVGLTERKRSRVRTYSGGMKRRLNLAAALIHEPLVIMLDEPTAGVDPQSRNTLFENIEVLRKEGHTIIYTTHYMEEAQRLCDRIAIMDQGKLLALGSMEELIANYGGKSILVAECEDQEYRIETTNPIVDLVSIQASRKLLRFKVNSPDLESVFLNLTGRKLRD